MLNFISDDQIDAALRNVAIPADLAARLKQSTMLTDDEIQGELTCVAIPHGLAARLRMIPQNDEIDARLGTVALAMPLKSKLQHIPRQAMRREHGHRVAMRAVAASLLFVLLWGYSQLAWSVLSQARSALPHNDVLTLVSPAAMNLLTETTEEPGLAIAIGPANVESPPSVAADGEEDEFEVASLLAAAAPVGTLPPSPLDEVLHNIRSERDFYATSSIGLRWLGATPLSNSENPQLDVVRLPVARGLIIPLIPGYDRGFLRRTGIHPPIVPRSSPTLEKSLAPLNFHTDSFDAALAAVGRGKQAVPPVRTEDFLAAMDYGLPRPAVGDLSLTVAGGPSHFGPERATMLSIGVAAGGPPATGREPVHVVLAIDFSSRLAEGGVWPWLQEALPDVLGRLGARDRMTLLFFQEGLLMQTTPLDHSPESVALLRESLANARPRGLADISVGIEAAVRAVTEANIERDANVTNTANKIVLVSDGNFQLLPESWHKLREVSGVLRDAGTNMCIMNVGGNEFAPGARELTYAIRGPQHVVASRREFTTSLLKTAYGPLALAASEVTMTVRFDPRQVAAYRLLGHEANTMAQLTLPGAETELVCGDEAMVLFEILPTTTTKESPSDVVAEVELVWREGVGGPSRSIKQAIARTQLATSWQNTPAAAQMAQLAAGTAEYFRGSRKALREIGWGNRNGVFPDDIIAAVQELSGNGQITGYVQLLSLLQSRLEVEGKAHRKSNR